MATPPPGPRPLERARAFPPLMRKKSGPYAAKSLGQSDAPNTSGSPCPAAPGRSSWKRGQGPDGLGEVTLCLALLPGHTQHLSESSQRLHGFSLSVSGVPRSRPSPSRGLELPSGSACTWTAVAGHRPPRTSLGGCSWKLPQSLLCSGTARTGPALLRPPTRVPRVPPGELRLDLTALPGRGLPGRDGWGQRCLLPSQSLGSPHTALSLPPLQGEASWGPWLWPLVLGEVESGV